MLSMPKLADNVELQTRGHAWKDKLLPALFAATLGLMLLYTAGFAEIPVLHNAAHDGRHSAAFPCH